MTVADLVKVLLELPQDHLVFVDDDYRLRPVDPGLSDATNFPPRARPFEAGPIVTL